VDDLILKRVFDEDVRAHERRFQLLKLKIMLSFGLFGIGSLEIGSGDISPYVFIVLPLVPILIDFAILGESYNLRRNLAYLREISDDAGNAFVSHIEKMTNPIYRKANNALTAFICLTAMLLFNLSDGIKWCNTAYVPIAIVALLYYPKFTANVTSLLSIKGGKAGRSICSTRLKALSGELLNDALKEIRSNRERLSGAKEERFLTAEYLLLEAKEYNDGAWEMLASEKCGASIALSRWVLEASMNLLWVVADKSHLDRRLIDLVGEALRCEANRLEGSAYLWPDKAQAFNNKANEARVTSKSLGANKLGDLCSRVDSIAQVDERIYALYRICCAEAHPGLKVWERYVKKGDITLSKSPVDIIMTARWMAIASVFYLVTFSYCLTELGEANRLKVWWQTKVVPILEES
jgi:hypothetical protein